MTTERYEHLTGLGEVHAKGRVVGMARYSIDVQQGAMGGLGRITGWLAPVGTEAWFPQAVIESWELELHLDDGRIWDCWIRSTSGDLVNRGQNGLRRLSDAPER